MPFWLFCGSEWQGCRMQSGRDTAVCSHSVQAVSSGKIASPYPGLAKRCISTTQHVVGRSHWCCVPARAVSWRQWPIKVLCPPSRQVSGTPSLGDTAKSWGHSRSLGDTAVSSTAVQVVSIRKIASPYRGLAKRCISTTQHVVGRLHWCCVPASRSLVLCPRESGTGKAAVSRGWLPPG